MRILRVLLAFVLVIAGVVSTVGSGGGGSDGGVNFDGLDGCCLSSTPPQPDVDITIDNAQDVSATVVQAIGELFDVMAKISGQIFPNPPAAPDLLSSNSKFDFFETVQTTEEPVIATCAVIGNVYIWGRTTNDPVSLSEGDVFELMFNSCDDGDGYILDGKFTLLVNVLDGDPRTDVSRLAYEVFAMALTVTSGIDTYVASASQPLFLLGWDSLPFPEIMLIASTRGLILSSQVDTYSWSDLIQPEKHSLTVNADTSIPATLAKASESLIESAALGGRVAYVIAVPLQAPDGQDPESGDILISGGYENGTIRIVIESSASVRLEIDVDGDGTVDDYQYTTWPALRG
jgi:hypothetical protein